MSKFKSFYINHGSYPYEILVCFGGGREDILDELDGKISVEDMSFLAHRDTLNLKGGKFIGMGSGVSLIWVHSQPRSSEARGSLAHEIFHAVKWLFDFLGIYLDDNSEEVWAYQVGYITEQIYEGLKR